jgi:hypothetical protein
MQVVRSPFMTGVNRPVRQPVPFSHEIHAGRLELDCRYCHTTVERSAFAGMPSTDICMQCHQHVWTGLPQLEPVRASYRTALPLAWMRVHNLPEFAFFDHSIHVQKGVGCATCHGRVDRMPVVWQTQTLHMQWCLECHREPERFVRPREEVFNMAWQTPADPRGLEHLARRVGLETTPTDQRELGLALVAKYRIHRYTSCSNCHQ